MQTGCGRFGRRDIYCLVECSLSARRVARRTKQGLVLRTYKGPTITYIRIVIPNRATAAVKRTSCAPSSKWKARVGRIPKTFGTRGSMKNGLKFHLRKL